MPFVDRGKIGVIGICGSALSAVSVDALPETDPITDEWQRFYAVPRGFHPNARGGSTTTSDLSMLQFDALAHIDEITPRPILVTRFTQDLSQKEHISLPTNQRKNTL